MDQDKSFEEVLIKSAQEILSSCIEVLEHVDCDSQEWVFALEMIRQCKIYLKKKD